MAAKLKVGDKAGDFTLLDQHGDVFQLSSFRGKKRVLLSFHPLAWTGICTRQMKSLERYQKQFDSLKTEAVGLSVDSVPCKAAWAKSLRLKRTRILADFWPHGRVAKRYGMFRDKNGFSERANVIVDERGIVVWMKIYPIRELPPIGEILTVLRKL